MRNFSLVVSLAIIPLSANAATVSCGLNESFGHPRVGFGEVSGDLQLDNYQDEGSLGITVQITGNGITSNFISNVSYAKVGNRLGLESGDDLWLQQVTPEEFKSQFGAFPELTCTTP